MKPVARPLALAALGALALSGCSVLDNSPEGWIKKNCPTIAEYKMVETDGKEVLYISQIGMLPNENRSDNSPQKIYEYNELTEVATPIDFLDGPICVSLTESGASVKDVDRSSMSIYPINTPNGRVWTREDFKPDRFPLGYAGVQGFSEDEIQELRNSTSLEKDKHSAYYIDFSLIDFDKLKKEARTVTEKEICKEGLPSPSNMYYCVSRGY